MKTSLNLLSERSRKRNHIRNCVRIWTRILGSVLVVATGIGLVQWRIYSQERARKDSVEAEYEPIRQLKIENVRLTKQIAELEQAETIPLKLAEHKPLLALVGLTTQAINQQQQRTYLKQLEILRAPLALDPKEEPLLSVVFKGVSIDKDSAEQVADSIREQGTFAKVNLKTRDVVTNDQQKRLAFSIECTN